MTFDKQVEIAKQKKLESRITRDAIFIILGIIFLLISIFSAVNNKKDENKNNQKTTNTTTINQINEN